MHIRLNTRPLQNAKLMAKEKQGEAAEKVRSGDVHRKAEAWWREGGKGGTPPSDNILGALKSKGGAKIRNFQCEISYKICKIQLVNKFKVVVILAFL